MHIVRRADAVPYVPKHHVTVRPVRLQGKEAGGPDRMSVAISEYPPGAGAALVESQTDLVYVVLEGQLVLETREGESTLHEEDSAYIALGEERNLINRSTEPARVMVIQAW